MHSLEMVVEIRVLPRKGEVDQGDLPADGPSRYSIRKYLTTGMAPVFGPRIPRPTRLDPYKECLRSHVAAAKLDWIPLQQRLLGSLMVAVDFHREYVVEKVAEAHRLRGGRLGDSVLLSRDPPDLEGFAKSGDPVFLQVHRPTTRAS